MMLFAIAVLILGAVACSNDEPSASSPSGDTGAADATSDISAAETPSTNATTGGDEAEADVDTNVKIVDFAFQPDDINAIAGEPVLWRNTGQKQHTVTFEEGGPSSSNIDPGGEYIRTFEDAGEFRYFCKIHGKDRMSGVVTVE